MLQLILGTNWRANRDKILSLVAGDVKNGRGGRVLLAPEQASHDYERRLCAAAGDSASRYAEVLSFTRLASRVFSLTGGGAAPVLDGGGRLLAMAAAVRNLSPRLKAYASVGTRPEFLSALVTAVDEFKSCCVTPETLQAASLHTEGALAQKLEELSLLLETYNSTCRLYGQDPRDRMTRLLEQMESSDFAREHTFYIDGFSDFTAQEMEIIAHALEESPCVTVSLVCDAPKTDTVGFELAGETAGSLLRLAERLHVPYEVTEIPNPEKDTPLGRMRQGLLSGPYVRDLSMDGKIHALRLSSQWEECSYAAGKIRELMASGTRCREISVVCAQADAYAPVLRQVFHQYGIPVYFAGNEDILHKSVIYTVITALEAVAEGLDRENVLRYLKSVLSPLTAAECDELENYAIAWRIRGKAWAEPFTRHPGGLVEQWSQEDRETLERLERNRVLGAGPLLELDKALKKAASVLDMLEALYAFLERVQLSERLEMLTAHFEETGDARSAREQEQLWDILVGAMEQMGALLGDTPQTPDSFLQLLKLLLSQYSVGTIPQTLDSVMVGGIPAMRRQEANYVFLLGAREGCLPSGSSGGMVLTEQERKSLMDLGVPLRADLYRQLQQELAGILAVAGSAAQDFTMTVSGGDGAYSYRRLCRMLGKSADAEEQLPLTLTLPDAWAASARYIRAEAKAPKAIAPVQEKLKQLTDYSLGTLSPQAVRGLYGEKLMLSASQVDKVASCRFAYFLHYGLRLKERKEITIDPAEFGTFVHDVLQHAVERVKELGGFREVSLEATMEIAMACAQDYQNRHFADLSGSDRGDYLFRRNLEELQAVVRMLWEELSQSLFQPRGCEVKFGRDGDMPLVSLPGGAMPAYLQGSVDRLDLYEKDGQTFMRVVDYKTGSKSFDFTNVLNGIGLQMLIYLFALEDEGESYLGCTPEAAGVLYFPARARILSAKDVDDRKAKERKLLEESRRKGLVLADEDIRRAMDATEDGHLLPKGEDYLVTPFRFGQLKEYVMKTLASLVDEIAGGNVQPNPCFRGNEKPCTYCEFASSCHLELWGQPREYKETKSEEFWNRVAEGVKDRG